MWHSHFGCDHKGIIGVPPPFLRPPLDGRSELSESPTVPIGEAFQVGVDRIPFMAVHPQEFAHPFGQSGARGRFCLVLRLAWSWINFLQTLPKLSVWLYLATYCSTKSTSPFVSSHTLEPISTLHNYLCEGCVNPTHNLSKQFESIPCYFPFSWIRLGRGNLWRSPSCRWPLSPSLCPGASWRNPVAHSISSAL